MAQDKHHVPTNEEYAKTKSLDNAQSRLAKDKASKVMAKLDIEIRAKRLSVQEGMTLGMVYSLAQANPDGQFAQTLVAMIQGEF